MTISVNGQDTDIPDGFTVADLLVFLEKDPKFLAVERNLELVSRRNHADVVLEPDDRIEIVTLVGGG